MTTQRRTLQGLGNGVLVLMLLWTAIPFYWMIVTSLKHDKEIYGYEATLIPQRPTVDNYVTVFRTTPYLLYLRHSMAVEVLRRCYRSGADPERRLPALSTYLGHTSLNYTYWYLHQNPSLMKQAMARMSGSSARKRM